MSTPGHEPTGTYPRRAAIHHIDLEAEIGELVAKLPGNRRQGKNVAREGGLSIVLIAMEAGDEMDEHAAAGAATVQVLRGSVVLSSGDEQLPLSEGELAMYQPGVRHRVRAEQQSVIMLTVAEQRLAG